MEQVTIGMENSALIMGGAARRMETSCGNESDPGGLAEPNKQEHVRRGAGWIVDTKPSSDPIQSWSSEACSPSSSSSSSRSSSS
jgi:hypothetical protein